MVHLFGAFVARAYNDLLIVAQVGFGYALYFLAHGGGEEQCVAFFGYAGQYFVDAFRKAHVEHFVGFVEHYVFHGVEAGHAALHEVYQSARGGHDHLGAFAQGTYLALYARTAVDGEYVQAVDVA